MIWSPAADVHLRELAAAGLTSTQIALELRCSRNAVLGRCFRQNVALGAARKSAAAALKKRTTKKTTPTRRHYHADWNVA
jgi:hypothetical protein